ncbi:MAG: transglutaminase domain-containing protein [Sphaerochaetaceae bacterium]|jgi:hypothetical protein|nr:transglutaminase domain-containing protein [Sphaerochaetaceae bacterium]
MKFLRRLLAITVVCIAAALCLHSAAQPYCYHRTLLSSSEQDLYTRISDCIELGGSSIEDVPSSESVLNKVFDYVLLDHPGFFYCLPEYTVITNTRNGVPYRYDMEFSFDSLSSHASRYKSILSSISTILSRIGSNVSEYDLVRGVYEQLGRNTVYDESYPDQSLYSVLVCGRGVCAGFAKAFACIMDFSGIPCITVTGTLEGQNHSWNMVRIGGKWYHIDVTSSASLSDSGDAFYSFLCISDTQIAQTHVADPSIPLPSAISNDLEFFQKNGRKLNQWNFASFKKMLHKATGSSLSVKFGSPSSLDDAISDLFTKSQIFEAFKAEGINLSTVNYSINRDFSILTISLV